MCDCGASLTNMYFSPSYPQFFTKIKVTPAIAYPCKELIDSGKFGITKFL